jgi:hypothetical protein
MYLFYLGYTKCFREFEVLKGRGDNEDVVEKDIADKTLAQQ